jgi:replicative DNA helicase
MQFADALSVAMADATAAHESRLTGKPRGPVTGFKHLDTELGGAFAPGVHSINGDPAIGKTAFALQVAATCQFPALFITCEMAPAELLRRHAARVTGTFLGRFKSGEMPPPTACALFQQAIDAAPMLKLLDGTNQAIFPAWIQEQALVMLEHHEARGVLIVVDSLHSWAEAFAGDAGEYDYLNRALAGLRSVARNLNCPVLFVTEKNRDSMKNGDGGQSSGAGSRKIEYGAETVISLMKVTDGKGKLIEEDGDGEKPVNLILAKNRHGAAGKPISLSFNGALQRFTARYTR